MYPHTLGYLIFEYTAQMFFSVVGDCLFRDKDLYKIEYALHDNSNSDFSLWMWGLESIALQQDMVILLPLVLENCYV